MELRIKVFIVLIFKKTNEIIFIHFLVVAVFYFISFQIIAGFIVQNLFILIILQAFDFSEEGETLEKIQELIESFKIQWRLMANKQCHYKLEEKNIIAFIKKLPQPLGFLFLFLEIFFIVFFRVFAQFIHGIHWNRNNEDEFISVFL